MEKALNYSDIYLVPNYSELNSRSEANVSAEFLGRKFKLPVTPANMASVINEDLAKWCSENDYFYIMHRFDGATESLVKRANKENWKTISISVGVNQIDYEFIEKWAHTSLWKIDFITIDVAHGNHLLAKKMIEHIKAHLNPFRKSTTKIIAGNVCTHKAVRDLYKWGADAVKVGIAGGGACSTKNQTGFHIPMFTCVQNCSDLHLDIPFGQNIDTVDMRYLGKIPIIADGGIRENGDFAKALVAGANMVMAGTMFAACTDAPGENVYGIKHEMYTHEGLPYTRYVEDKGLILKKKYFGSASAKQKGENKHVEGFEVELPCNGLTYSAKFQEIKESLQSAVSYAGGKDLSAFSYVKYITVK